MVSRLLFLVLLSLFPQLFTAQKCNIVGVVKDKENGALLPYTTIFVENSKKYLRSNENGQFLLPASKEQLLTLSILGYKTVRITIKPIHCEDTITIKMEQLPHYLDELVVRPPRNPAVIVLEEVRKRKDRNNISSEGNLREETAIFVTKYKGDTDAQKLLESLEEGTYTTLDSTTQHPIYMEEKRWEKDTVSAVNVFASTQTATDGLTKMLQGAETELNVYKPTFNILGKSIINPIATAGNAYYQYNMLDTIESDIGTQYKIKYTPKQIRNTALKGYFLIDSLTYAVTYFNAILPKEANVNFIKDLAFFVTFDDIEGDIVPRTSSIIWKMTYELFDESLLKNPELMITRSQINIVPEDTLLTDVPQQKGFANTGLQATSLNEKLKKVQSTPLYKIVEFTGNIALTAHVPLGKFEIGNVADLARWTMQEGVRIGLPFKTNKYLNKHISLNGFVGYGFKNKSPQYRLGIHWIPTSLRWDLRLSLGNQYRRIDFDENGVAWQEETLVTGDDNIANTIFLLSQGTKTSQRKNWRIDVHHDWNEDWETKLSYQQIGYFSNEAMPMIRENGTTLARMRLHRLTMVNRISFSEKTIDNNFQRIYIRNHKPVFFATTSLGQVFIDNQTFPYAEISLLVQHKHSFAIGGGRYALEIGKGFGKQPYFLLNNFQGNEKGNYSRRRFSLMNYNEFVADTYVTLHSEFMFNGLLINQLPLIKYLNLREFISVKAAYGVLSKGRSSVLLQPKEAIHTMRTPYTEIGVGITNLLNFITIQSVWRLTNLNSPNVRPWGITLSMMFSY